MRQLDFGMQTASPPRRETPRRARRPKPEVQLPLFANAPHPADTKAEIEAEAAAAEYAPIRAESDSALDGDALTPDPQTTTSVRATIRGKVKVEAFLRQLLGPKVIVQLTENRSTMLSYSRKKGVLYVRIHAIFADAPEHVLGAVARFVSESKPGPKVAWLIDQWIEAHRHLVKREGRGLRVLPKGEVHDLQLIYDQINADYFKTRVTSRITWSVAAKKQKRSSIRMGSYSEDEKLIRIHPALDQAFVPEYFVASVVFHEMLHELHGAHEAADGTRRVHTPAFRKDEAKFKDYHLARAWEAKNLHRLLRY